MCARMKKAKRQREGASIEQWCSQAFEHNKDATWRKCNGRTRGKLDLRIGHRRFRTVRRAVVDLMATAVALMATFELARHASSSLLN